MKAVSHALNAVFIISMLAALVAIPQDLNKDQTMKTYIKALGKCHVPVKLDAKWLGALMFLYKIKLGKLVTPVFLKAYNWHDDTEKEMLSHSRLFLGYDGALDCAGRDTDEFIADVGMRMAESAEFFMGRVAPRVEMSIAFDDPDRFPYQYVKWTTLLNIYLVKEYLNKHKLWIAITGLLITTNIMTIFLTGAK